MTVKCYIYKNVDQFLKIGFKQHDQNGFNYRIKREVYMRVVHNWPQRHWIRMTGSIIAIEQESIALTIGKKRDNKKVKLGIIQDVFRWGGKVPKALKWPDPRLFLTLTKQKKITQEGEKTRQCNGCCLKQEKKQKCSEATCPLPMSHAARSPLVETARGAGPSPGQSARSMQMVSGELCLMDDGWGGREDQKQPTWRPHLERAERRSTGSSSRGRGVLEV